MMSPPIPPSTRIGTYLWVIMASGRLMSDPNSNPTNQPGQEGNSTQPMTKPMANRLKVRCAEQAPLSYRKGHRQHQSDIQSAKYHTGDQTKDNFRHVYGFSALALRLQPLVRIRSVNAILSQNPARKFR